MVTPFGCVELAHNPEFTPAGKFPVGKALVKLTTPHTLWVNFDRGLGLPTYQSPDVTMTAGHLTGRWLCPYVKVSLTCTLRKRLAGSCICKYK